MFVEMTEPQISKVWLTPSIYTPPPLPPFPGLPPLPVAELARIVELTSSRSLWRLPIAPPLEQLLLRKVEPEMTVPPMPSE